MGRVTLELVILKSLGAQSFGGPQYEGCVDSVVWRMQVAPIRLDPQIVCEAAAFRWEMVEQRLLDVSQCNSRPCQIIFFHD